MTTDQATAEEMEAALKDALGDLRASPSDMAQVEYDVDGCYVEVEVTLKDGRRATGFSLRHPPECGTKH